MHILALCLMQIPQSVLTLAWPRSVSGVSDLDPGPLLRTTVQYRNKLDG